jgi:hypothetical protein
MTKGDLMPKPALYFKEIGYVIFPLSLFLPQCAHGTKCRDDSHVTAKFTPILRAYITSDYQETAIIRGVINMPVIWEQDLAALSDSTTWNLIRDPFTGHYTIEEA